VKSLAGALGDHALPHAREQALLAVTTDHRSVQAAGVALLAAHRDQAVSDNGLALALELERLDLLDLHRIASQPQRRLADQDLARLRRLLEPRRHVDRVASSQPLLGSGDDLARGNPDPPLHGQLGKGVAHLDRRPQGAQRVVFV